MSPTILAISAISLAIVAVIISIISWRQSALTRTIKQWFGSEPDPETLQEVLLKIADKIEKIVGNQKAQAETIEQISTTLNTAIRYVGITRFDSNSSDGGNLSFSIAMLDGSQSGIVFTSLHGREHNRVYVKTISNGLSPHTLSEEETQAIMDALQGPAQVAEKKGNSKTRSNLKTK